MLLLGLASLDVVVFCRGHFLVVVFRGLCRRLSKIVVVLVIVAPQEALEQAEQEGRRRSSGGLGSSTRSSPSARQSWPSPPVVDGVAAATGRDSGGRSSLSGTGGKGSSGKISRSGRSSTGWRSGSGGGSGEGVGMGVGFAAPRDDDNAATAYSRALARVRHETVQEGLRHGHGREREGAGRHAQIAK